MLHLSFLAVQAAFEGPGRKGRAQTEQESELSGAEQKAHPKNHVSLEMANYGKHKQKH